MKSSSNLTRAVFRSIIDNKPLVVAECRRHVQRPLPRSRPYILPYTQRRNRMFGAIFNAANAGFEGAKNTPRNLEIALGKLVDLVRARRTQSRGPPDEEVLDAFRFLFKSSLESHRRLTRNEIYLATEVFMHLQEKGLVSDAEEKSTLTRKDLDLILRILALPLAKEKFRSDIRALADLVFVAYGNAEQAGVSGQARLVASDILSIHAAVLARTGSASEASGLLKTAPNSNLQENVQAWIEVLKGFASEGRRKEFDAHLGELHEQLRSFTAPQYEELVGFLAANDNFAEARRVYETQVNLEVEVPTAELQQLLELCVRTSQLSYGQSIAGILEARIQEDGVLGTLLVWTAARSDTLDSVTIQLRRLVELSPASTLNMEAFNRVVEIGYMTNRPELATAALDIAQSIGMEPDGRFYALQLQHALQRGDLSAASQIYEELVHHDFPSDDSDIPVLNSFLTALAFSPASDYNLLTRVIDNLLERNAHFEAESLAGVCRVFLQRNELEDLTGLLRHRVDFYPGPDRARVSAVFQEFILDPSVSEQRAFNAYELFRIAFPETPVEQRLPIMQSFFDRNRSDLACLVFGHMRQREDIEARPTADAYAQCFAGIAQCRDIDGLQMVYNMLKLDLEVDPTTRVRNGLMLAYIACQMPYTAMIDHFWKIMDSREGPSYSTFEIALRACETWVPQGGYEARKIMAIVQAWNLEVTKDMYDCYVGALAGQSEFENTIEMIEEMQDQIGEQPDAFTIGAFYNAIPWQYRKDEVEKWARKAYPDLWEDLESYGDEIDEEWEVRYFKIDRSINIDDPPLFASGKYDPQISQDVVHALEPPPEKSVTGKEPAKGKEAEEE